MGEFRREFLKMAGLGVVGGSVSLLDSASASAQRTSGTKVNTSGKPLSASRAAKRSRSLPQSIPSRYSGAPARLSLWEVRSKALIKSRRLQVNVYPGADANFTLFSDDGTTYEKGAGSITRLHWDDAKQMLTHDGGTGWNESDSKIVKIAGH